MVATQHAQAVQPPSAREIAAILAPSCAARLSLRLMRWPLGRNPSYAYLCDS